MTQRTAALNLDWEEYDSDDYGAELPSLPGFPYPIGFYVYDTEDGWWFEIGDGKTDLENTDFGIPTGASAEEMMTAVESLNPQDVVDKLVAIGYAPDENMDWPHTPASRQASRRTASLGLEWYNPSEDTWQADLPAIPGYTDADGNDSFVTVVGNGSTELAVPYDAVCTIFLSQGGVVNLNLWDMWSFDPFGPDAQDVMQAVDDLDVYDISHQLESMGYEPMVNDEGEYVVAARKACHATRRNAHFDLEWEKEEDGSYFAPLPYSYDAYVYDAATVRGSSQTGWRFQITDGYYILDDTDFGIPAASTAEEAMSEVENLTFEDIDKKMIELFSDQ